MSPNGRRRPGRRCHAVRHRRHLRLRYVGGVPRTCSGRPPRRRRSGHQGRQRDERRPTGTRTVAAVGDAVVRGQPAPPANRPHRRVSDAPTRSRHAHRRDSAGLRRPGSGGQGARRRDVDVLACTAGGSSRRRRTAGLDRALQRATTVLCTRACRRGRGPAVVSPARCRHAGLGAAQRRVVDREVPVGIRRLGVARGSRA